MIFLKIAMNTFFPAPLKLCAIKQHLIPQCYMQCFDMTQGIFWDFSIAENIPVN